MKTFIIVEGKTDTAKLKSIFPLVETIETGGSSLDETKLVLIKRINLNNKVIIFTDPDYPGQKIRQIVSDYLNNECLHAFIDKNDAIKGKKVGIAEASVLAIRNSLKNVITFEGEIKSLHWKEYVNLIDTKYKREIICQYYQLFFANNKTVFKWLNYMNVNKRAVSKILKENSHG